MTTDPTAATAVELSDLAQAAFLLAKGHVLRDVLGSPGGRRIFVFPSSARDDAASYWAGASIPARLFANALRDLKAQLFR